MDQSQRSSDNPGASNQFLHTKETKVPSKGNILKYPNCMEEPTEKPEISSKEPALFSKPPDNNEVEHNETDGIEEVDQPSQEYVDGGEVTSWESLVP